VSSTYIFKARLCGLLCSEFSEPLANTTVRLYRSREGQNVTVLAAAQPKTTFAALDDDAVEEKRSSLLAEATTDEQGLVVFELGERDDYRGEAFELDVVCATVPGQLKPTGPARQFSITTLQPAWREREEGLVAGWDYCIPQRVWCWLRGLFGAWTISGQVVTCDGRKPIGGVTVRAFDRDWLQDDDLGSALTDAAGHFRIDYSWAAFQPGTFINVELFGGPDLYFRVESAGGTPLLVEAPARARDADRENVGPCFCVELCLEKTPPTPDPIPVFTHVGGYKHLTQIQPANGLTVGDDRAFFSTMRLNGILAKKLSGAAMEYRFEVRTTNDGGGSPGPWSAIDPSQIARTKIGDLENYAPAFPGDPDPIKTRDYTVNGTAGPDEVVANIAGGWIRVPQESNVFGPEGYFSPNGNMIALVSETLATFATIDKTGLTAGSSGAPVGAAKHFSLRMRVRQVGVPASEVNAGTCAHIAVNDMRYENVLHHPAWMAVLEPSALGVAMVDIAQLVTVGCSDIDDQLDVLFTATHPNLGAVSLTMSGPGGPYGFTLPAAATPGQNWFGTATPGFTVSALKTCAYIVTLSVQLLLTTGDSIPSNLVDEIPFCKA